MDEAPLSGLRPHNLHYAKLPPACCSYPRPPSVSGYGGSHCVARSRLACLAPIRPRVAPQNPERRAAQSGKSYTAPTYDKTRQK